jgi:hypothetical protein
MGAYPMNGLIEATYEGNGLLRLKQDLKNVQPNAEVKIMVLTPLTEASFTVDNRGIEGLRQQLREFERQYNMDSAFFFEQFNQGKLGDSSDFVVWAGLYEVSLELTHPEHGR